MPLSYSVSQEIIKQLKELENSITEKYTELLQMSEEERNSIHQFARISQIGASTRIENAVLTDAEILWIDTILTKSSPQTSYTNYQNQIKNKLSQDRERSIEEVAGCRDLLFLVYQQHQDFIPLTEMSLRGMHQILLQYYPEAHHYLGQYKSVTNSVVERNHKTNQEKIVFKTADPGPITDVAMQNLILWYNENLSKEPWTLTVACEFVYRFLAIHPFQDGNGRLGRALFLLALLQSPIKALSELARFLAIDRYIEKHKIEYYSVLQNCSGGIYSEDPKKYKIEIFLKYMIKILKESLSGFTLSRERFASIQKLSESAYQVWDCFKDFPEKKLKTKDIMENTGLPRRTIIHALNQLLEGHLIQRQGQGAGTRYQVIF